MRIFLKYFIKKMYLLTTKATPQPFLWEMALLGTIIPTLVGWTALAKVFNLYCSPLIEYENSE